MTASERPVDLTGEQAAELLILLGCPPDQATREIASMKWSIAQHGPMESAHDTGGGLIKLIGHARETLNEQAEFVFWVQVTGQLEDVVAQYLQRP